MTDKKFREDLLKLASDDQDYEAAMRVYGHLSRLGLIKPIEFYQNLPVSVFVTHFTWDSGIGSDIQVWKTEEAAYDHVLDIMTDEVSGSVEMFQATAQDEDIRVLWDNIQNLLGNNPTIQEIASAMTLWNEWYVSGMGDSQYLSVEEREIREEA